MMRRHFGLIVALACAGQLVAGAGFQADSGGNSKQLLTSEQISKKLNEAELSPEQIMKLLNSQEPTRLGPIFKDFYADELERNAFAVPSDCFDSILFGRRRLCEMLDMADDGSQAYENLSRFCWGANEAVVSYCADKMNPPGPRPNLPEFGLFKEVAARNPGADRLSAEALIEALGAEDLEVEDVYLDLSLAADKEAKLVDNQTVQDFFNLNQFNLAQCKPEALQRRHQFCSKVAPSGLATLTNNYKSNLTRFCRATLKMTAHYCDTLKRKYPNWADQFDAKLTEGRIDGHMKFVEQLQSQ